MSYLWEFYRQLKKQRVLQDSLKKKVKNKSQNKIHKSFLF